MKTILVTGTNRGLGKAICQTLLSKGHQVIATARSSSKGEKTFNELKSEFPNGKIDFVSLDVTSIESINEMYKYLTQKHDKVDCLVNNAGVFSTADFEALDEKELRTVMEVNLFGPFNICQKMIPLLEKSNDAKIINVSSQMGSLTRRTPAHVAYRISKTAINSMTRVMSVDLEPKRISVFAVCPGWVHTDMGGPDAPRTPQQGAESILFPFFNTLENGGYFQDGKAHPW